MGKYGSAAIVFLLLVFLNRMLAVSQQLRLNKNLRLLKTRGPVCSTGMEKSLLGIRIAVLIADKSGKILEAYTVRGRSIFSGYRLDKGFQYHDCFEAKEALEGKKRKSTQDKAYLSAVLYLVNGLEQLA